MNESSRLYRIKLFTVFLTVGIISLLQPGCSSSSSSGNTTPPQATVIVAVTPQSGSITALVGTTVSAAFSVDMDAATVENGFMLTLGGVPVAAAQPVYDAAGRTVTLVPDSDLQPGQQYRATISETVKDVNGNSPLSTDFIWSFTTSAAMQLVSSDVNTVVGDNASQASDIDDSGRYLVFASRAGNLSSVATTTARQHIYRKDMSNGAVVLVSVDSSGTLEAETDADNPAISGDGRYVVFQSAATNLDNTVSSQGTLQIYLKDLQTGSIKLISRSASLAVDDGAGAVNARVSDDGQFVVFESTATNLVQIASGGFSQIYRKNTINESIELISRTAADVAGNGNSMNPEMSADGRHIVFESLATNFSGASGFKQVFHVDTGAPHAVTQISLNTAGSSALADSEMPSLSDNGERIAFQTIDSLDPADSNGFVDIYVRDRLAGTTQLISRSPSTLNAGDGASGNARISGNGNYVVFESLATDLDLGAVGIKDIFVRKLSALPAVVIDRVNNPQSNMLVSNDSNRPVISTDGRYVGFDSIEAFTLDDSNTLPDVFRAYNTTAQ